MDSGKIVIPEIDRIFSQECIHTIGIGYPYEDRTASGHYLPLKVVDRAKEQVIRRHEWLANGSGINRENIEKRIEEYIKHIIGWSKDAVTIDGNETIAYFFRP